MYEQLQELRAKLGAVKKRIAVVRGNLNEKQLAFSTTLLSLQMEEKRLQKLIDEYVPHDFTPNPGGSSPTPAAALMHA